ncbi:type VII secretion integral membrane protein EccD [Actinosynnema sp. NPDC050436]|uniref:type VII secretion integral membrane protein EccD n=1 Tax=Actinosynnema sp. NPDC050436 TaxID=3155659 RepID=UPI00340FFC4C
MRLRFALGDKATDVALPAHAPLVDLLPVILTQFGTEWVEQGADHEGWVVQRVGGPPLDEDRTPAELELLDGETVHLRPRADRLAAIDYDDLVDGVGEQVREHPGAWRPAHTRWMFRVGAALALLLGAVLLPTTGAGAAQAVTALVVAVLLLAGGALVARGAGDPQTAVVLAGVAACYGGLGGSLVVRVFDPGAAAPVHATVALAVALLVLTTGVVAVADASTLFTGGIMFAAVTALTGLIASATAVLPHQAAAIGLLIALVVGVFVPATAFRLSGLTLPMLPTGADELGQDIDPVPARVVVERGALTAGYSMALHAGLGAALAVLLPVLVADGGTWSVVLSLVVAFLLVLRSRHPSGVVERWSVLVPAIVCVAGCVRLAAAAQTGLGGLFLVCVPLVVAGVVLLLAGRVFPGKRQRPYWGRAVEILESVTAVAVVPILLQVLGVYAWMRGLAG